MESSVFLSDLLTAHEPKMRKPMEINERIFGFMGSGHLQRLDVNRSHEPDRHPSPCPLPARRGEGGRRPGEGLVHGKRDRTVRSRLLHDVVRRQTNSLEPDLNFIAIRIGDVSVGEARSELATAEQAPPRAFDLGNGTADVAGVHEPKAEMRDAPAETGGRGGPGAGADVRPATSPSEGPGLPPAPPPHN